MEDKVKKSSLDLDFGDIAGKIVEKEAAPISDAPVDPKMTGIMILVHEDGVPKEKDLALCTNEEFSSWCTTVLPGYTLREADLSPLHSKIQAFKNIVSWGQVEIFTMKRKERQVH